MLKCEQCKTELSMYHNPKTGHTVAKWVDDIITRGPKAAQLEYWENLGKRFDIKSWGIVAINKPRVFCNKEIFLCWKSLTKIEHNFGIFSLSVFVSVLQQRNIFLLEFTNKD